MEKTALLRAETNKAKVRVRTAALASVIAFAFAASGAVSPSGITGFISHATATVKSGDTDSHVLAGIGQSGCCGGKS